MSKRKVSEQIEHWKEISDNHNNSIKSMTREIMDLKDDIVRLKHEKQELVKRNKELLAINSNASRQLDQAQAIVNILREATFTYQTDPEKELSFEEKYVNGLIAAFSQIFYPPTEAFGEDLSMVAPNIGRY